VPVFVDSDPKTLNVWSDWDWGFQFKNIKAMIFAHTLGNPVDLSELTKYNIPIIEDACDSIGSTINGEMVGRKGVMSTASFYPAHHITMGEGGAVMTDSPRLKKVIESYRDWGRSCYCAPGQDNACGKRFDYEVEHKYMYERLGYNMKATDFQAAVGVAQLDRLEGFVQRRKDNWNYLRTELDNLPIDIVEATPNSNPSWFGFAFLTERRNELQRYLDERGIGSRPIMGGNLTKQEAYKNVEYKVIGNLAGADLIHKNGVWIGVFPGITDDMRQYQVEILRKFFNT
jgi:CDP-6-deoxy-D-xylo-4-hexulose-3-dehydrase